ncbi:MAG TPA: stage III sporulation protein AD [Firmicutes bacterium]|nr:stage III sporulation protein AD [Bacillota bacterium]
MTAQIFQLVGIALITAVAAILVKSTKPELALAVTIAGSVILLLFVLEVFRGSIGIFTEIAEMTGLDAAIVKTLLKMVGIGYLVEFGAGILNDFGQNSLADKLVFCGKLLVLILAVPILESILELISDLLGLIA